MWTFYESRFNEINIRMLKSSFSLKTSDQHTKVIHFQGGTALVSWMLWKSKFQVNSYHTMSSDKNFTNNINRIVSLDPGETFDGTITETQYASGNRVYFQKSLTNWSNSILIRQNYGYVYLGVFNFFHLHLLIVTYPYNCADNSLTYGQVTLLEIVTYVYNCLVQLHPAGTSLISS